MLAHAGPVYSSEANMVSVLEDYLCAGTDLFVFSAPAIPFFFRFNIYENVELLADERAVGPLLSYLKDTEVGSREGAAEVTREWRRRSDQEGEEQLGNS